MSDSLEHVINLVTGDWSGDGHCHRDTLTIRSNLSADDLQRAYRSGCDVVGFDLTRDVASDYEDSYIQASEIQKLAERGFDISQITYDEVIEGSSALSIAGPEAFAEMWLFIAGLGDIRFKWMWVDGDIRIGGYGLFIL